MLNRWAVVLVLDAAKLYRQVMESNQPGASYQAGAEEGIAPRDIARTLGKGLHLPAKSIRADEAAAYVA
ncbi:hypothetical protein [Oleiagrimonas sp. MCCC 1A03011]|uniref:hypothetical protein n=1 Tax=Oleiagrimonas sp. MCCC 1A03011 TaxID=1926883 RepID=UPI000DC5931E|nr:hypothetical protein [Oleiagrimonas sp. MCCC 1A03011]RAP58324.1 hypothetical protein BTJ49_05045 [Oleiagrimonas sp. MCCC 1A03011]